MGGSRLLNSREASINQHLCCPEVLGRQGLRPHPDLGNQNLHFPKKGTSVLEALDKSGQKGPDVHIGIRVFPWGRFLVILTSDVAVAGRGQGMPHDILGCPERPHDKGGSAPHVKSSTS